MVHRDIDGNEIPTGKVHRRLEGNFVTDTVPNWITTYSNNATTSLTNRPISNGRGPLRFSCDGTSGGINLPAVDPTAFREIRIGAAMSVSSGGDMYVNTGFANTTGDIADNGTDGVIVAAEYNAADTTATVNEVGGGDKYDTNYSYVLEGKPIVMELRLRPFEDGVTVLGGGGTSVFWEQNGLGMSYDTYYPKIEIAPVDGNGDVDISKIWMDVFHN
ncbi:hypothetical protein [Haloarcula marina]|uniref:hypothetical protein n=1 Tax=Haloarcula marina TaxID=2961574 RepID=UPI0020B751DC|nr:hypothetical protein [Halomicroarcula marina]